MTEKDVYDYLIAQKRTNKDGITYNFIDSQHREQDTAYIASLLFKYGVAIQGLLNISQEQAITYITKTIDKMACIRVDQTDSRIGPMSVMFDEFTDKGRIRFEDKIHDGVTNFTIEHGIMMLTPDLISSKGNLTSIQTFIHEFLHAQSTWIKDDKMNIGIWTMKNRGVLEGLNEGINEYLTRIVMCTMYPGREGELDFGRYRTRVDTARAISGNMTEEEQRAFFTNYIAGNGEAVIEQLATMPTKDGGNVYDMLRDMHDSTELTNRNSPEDMRVRDTIINNLAPTQQASQVPSSQGQ